MAQDEWASSSAIFPLEFCQKLAKKCLLIHAQGLFRPAAIGQGNTKINRTDLRGDFTSWIDEDTPSLLLRSFREQIDTIRLRLNESFYLGLREFETHFAVYPPGGEYKKHVDNPRGSGARQITFILYLNNAWEVGDGGELSFFQPGNEEILFTQIQPRIGTFVFFRSDVFPHQVEISKNQRLSLTGWFRNS